VSDQLSLFGEPPDASPAGPAAPADPRLAAAHAEAAEVAAQLPEGLRFGTSSWSFPGWAGLVYPSARPTTALARDGLRDYARHPLLRTVGVDRSYYAPVPIDDLRAYAGQLPPGFPCCFKAPASVMSLAVPAHGGPARPGRNPDFLSVPRVEQDLLRPLAAAFAAHTGPVLLEFPPFPRGVTVEPARFAARLDRFLGELPRQFEYAVELRDRHLLTDEYRTVLARHGAAHVYNYWSAMPMPGAQADVVPPEEPPFSVIRLLLRPGTWYEDQREAFRPFDRIVEPDLAMRAEVVALGRRALGRGRRVYVLVNNKAEGSSPLTVRALARRFAGLAG
jgi:uncharacterized protein YecE (DUF72 family)